MGEPAGPNALTDARLRDLTARARDGRAAERELGVRIDAMLRRLLAGRLFGILEDERRTSVVNGAALRFARRYLSRGDASDCETVADLWRVLYRQLADEIRTRYRQAVRRERAADDLDPADESARSPAERAEVAELAGRLEELMAECLTPRQRAVLEARAGGEDFARIGERVGLTTEAARQDFHRARGRILELLEGPA